MSHVARAVVHAVKQAAHHVSQVVHHYYQRASSYVSHVFHRPSATKKKVSAALTPPRKVRPGEKNAKLAAQWAAYSKTNAAEAAHQSQVAANWDVALQAAHNVDMFVSVYGIALGGVEAGAKYMAGRAAGAATEAAIGEVAANCFVRGTPVATAAGLVPIGWLHPGDLVLSRDSTSDAQSLKRVVRTVEHPVTDLMHIRVANDTVTATPNHPFRVAGRGWVEAGDLATGDTLCLADGGRTSVVSVIREKLSSPVDVYNLEVEDFHTYFVATAGVWVHNCGSEVARGGVYTLTDEAGTVLRTGRSNNLAARELAHKRAFPDLQFNVAFRTDSYAEQRGLEEMLYENHPSAQVANGGLNKIRGISLTNPNRSAYLGAAESFLSR